MAAGVVSGEELAHFEAHGFCVVRSVITPAEAEAGRAMMDELFTQVLSSHNYVSHRSKPHFASHHIVALLLLESVRTPYF